LPSWCLHSHVLPKPRLYSGGRKTFRKGVREGRLFKTQCCLFGGTREENPPPTSIPLVNFDPRPSILKRLRIPDDRKGRGRDGRAEVQTSFSQKGETGETREAYHFSLVESCLAAPCQRAKQQREERDGGEKKRGEKRVIWRRRAKLVYPQKGGPPKKV